MLFDKWKQQSLIFEDNRCWLASVRIVRDSSKIVLVLRDGVKSVKMNASDESTASPPSSLSDDFNFYEGQPRAPRSSPVSQQSNAVSVGRSQVLSSQCETCNALLDFYSLKCPRLSCQIVRVENLLNSNVQAFRTLVYEPLVNLKALDYGVVAWLEKATFEHFRDRFLASGLAFNYPLLIFVVCLRDFENVPPYTQATMCHLCGLRVKSMRKYSCYRMIVLENLETLFDFLKERSNFCPVCFRTPLFVLSSFLEVQVPI